jgi:hypothetical protein
VAEGERIGGAFRSSIDRHVWVSYIADVDEATSFGAAGSLRGVKRYVERTVDAGPLIWHQDGPDGYVAHLPLDV